MRLLLPSCLLGVALFAPACDWNSPDDYNPKKDFKAWQLKQAESLKSQTEGTAVAGSASSSQEPGKKTYETYCVACHGIDGKAEGAALAMNPRPRVLVDKAWQAKVTDEHIYKVIKEGGTAVGLNAAMAPWGAVVSDEEIKNLVLYVRHFGK